MMITVMGRKMMPLYGVRRGQDLRPLLPVDDFRFVRVMYEDSQSRQACLLCTEWHGLTGLAGITEINQDVLGPIWHAE
jgi:hypothetical protein